MGEILRKELIILLVLLGVFLASGCAGNKNEALNNTVTPNKEVTPIMVGGQHIDDIFVGQFFFEDEPLDYELFRSQVRQYDFNEEEYIGMMKL